MATTSEIVWNNPEIVPGPFLTQKAYKAYSLAPSYKDLLAEKEYLLHPDDAPEYVKKKCQQRKAKQEEHCCQPRLNKRSVVNPNFTTSTYSDQSKPATSELVVNTGKQTAHSPSKCQDAGADVQAKCVSQHSLDLKGMGGDIASKNVQKLPQTPNLTTTHSKEEINSCSEESDEAMPDIQETKKKQMQKNKGVAYPGSKKRIPCLRKSALTVREHKIYLELEERFNRYIPVKPLPSDIRDLHMFKELQVKVKAEQQEFLAFLENSLDRVAADYDYINPDVKQYMDEYLSMQSKRVSMYPPYYVTHEHISLETPRVIANPPPLTHVQTLLAMGKVAKIIFPNVKPGQNVPMAIRHDRVRERFPPSHPSSPGKKTTWNKPVCSNDPNAEHLSNKFKTSVVASSSSLKCLVDNHGPAWERQWEIPVVIKEEKITENGKEVIHKTVYIDKPLPVKVPSTRQKNMWYHKYAVKATLQHPNHKNVYVFHEDSCREVDPNHRGDEQSGNGVEEDFQTNAADLFELETFESEKANRNKLSLKLEETLRSMSASMKKIRNKTGQNDAEAPVMKKCKTERDDVTKSEGVELTAEIYSSVVEMQDKKENETGDTEKKDVVASGNSTKDQSLWDKLNGNIGKDKTEDEKCESKVDGAKHVKEILDKNMKEKYNKIKEMDQSLSTSDEEDCLVIDCQDLDKSTDLDKDFNETFMETTSKNTENVQVKKQNGTKPHVSKENLVDPDVRTTRSGYKVPKQDHVPTIVELEPDIPVKRKTGRPYNKEVQEVKTLDFDSGEENKLVIDIEETDTEKEDSEDVMDDTTGSRVKVESLHGTGSDLVKPISRSFARIPKECKVSLVKMKDFQIEANAPQRRRSPRIKAEGKANKLKDESEHMGEITKDSATIRKVKSPNRFPVSPGRRFSSRLRGAEPISCDDESEVVPAKKGVLQKGRKEAAEEKKGMVQKGRKEVIEEKKNGAEEGKCKTSGLTNKPAVDSDCKENPNQESGTKSQKGEDTVTCSKSFSPPPASSLSPVSPDPSLVNPDQTPSDPASTLSPKRAGRVPKKTKGIGEGSNMKPQSVSVDVNLSTLEEILQAQNKLMSLGRPEVPDQHLPRESHFVSRKNITREKKKPVILNDMAENPEDYVQPADGNVTYNLWTLGDIPIIIRCGYHGNRMAKLGKPMRFVNLSPKLEYQPEFGLEQVTMSEACQAWLASTIRRGAQLVRARIHAFTSQIMMIEELNISQIIPQYVPYNPVTGVTLLYGVLSKLRDLPAGFYLLSHMPGNPQAHIKKNVGTSRGSYNLKLAYKNYMYMESQTGSTGPVPWVPIDPSMPLFWHKKYNRIPATFAPKDLQDQQGKKTWPKSKRKRKPRKRKNKNSNSKLI